MMKLLDYYYLVLLRWYDNMFRKDSLSYRVSGIVGFTLTLNLFALTVLFYNEIIDYISFWVGYIIIGWIIDAILDKIYNKNRREQLREAYKDESLESCQRGMALVILYEIFSIVFVVWAVSLAVR